MIKKLGSGSTAEVFLAYDTFLERKLAVKKGYAREILRREARILASLRSPFFPALYDYTEEEDAGLLRMEYIEGETLADREKRIGRYTEKEALEIAAQAARALHTLHTGRRPLVYGDLKPENILVTEEGNLRLIDFGTCAAAGTYREGETEKRGGTPRYASPEYWTGSPDARGDIYALGRLLQDMLRMGRGGVISRECRRLIERCVQKQPQKRYASAEEFLKDAGRL